MMNVSDVHSYNLRNSSVTLYVPKPKIEIGKHSLHYRGSVLWNKRITAVTLVYVL